MTPIPAVPPIDQALKLAMQAASPAKPAAPSAELAQKFEALMKHIDGTQRATEPSGHNVIGGLLQREQGEMSAVESRMDNLMAALPGMSQPEAVASLAAISKDVVVMSTKMQVATSLAQSSKGSLETLLKNQ
jgi:type III secretion inner rod protein HrpB2